MTWAYPAFWLRDCLLASAGAPVLINSSALPTCTQACSAGKLLKLKPVTQSNGVFRLLHGMEKAVEFASLSDS